MDTKEISYEIGKFDLNRVSTLLNTEYKNFKIGIDAFYNSHNRRVDADSAVAITDFTGATFSRKQESLEDQNDKSIGFTLRYRDFKLTSRYIENFKKNYQGFFGFLDFDDSGYSKFTIKNSELSYKKDILENLNLNFKIGFIDTNYKLNTYYYKYENIIPNLADPHYMINYTDRKLYTDLILNNIYFNKHKLKFKLHLAKVDTPNNSFFTNVDELAKVGYYDEFSQKYLPISSNLTELSGRLGFLNFTENQSISSYYLQDIYNFSDNLKFSLDFRFDDYEFFDSKLSYSLIATYLKDNRNIFKLLKSKSYNIPSLISTFFNNHFGLEGDRDLKAEERDTYQFIYTNSTLKNRFKFVTFYSIFKNYIDLEQVFDSLINEYKFKYSNFSEKIENYGFNFEYVKNFQNRSKLLFNFAYSRFKYRAFDTALSSKVTSNIGYIYPITNSLTIGTLVKFYGKQNMFLGNQIDDYTLFDSKVTYRVNREFTLSLNLKNIFDKKYYYYGYQNIDEKMQREGRVWFFNLDYKF